MNKIKRNILIVLIALNVLVLFGQTNGGESTFDTYKDDGLHSFEIPLNELARKLIKDEIGLFNNSTFDLDNIVCSIRIFE